MYVYRILKYKNEYRVLMLKTYRLVIWSCIFCILDRSEMLYTNFGKLSPCRRQVQENVIVMKNLVLINGLYMYSSVIAR